MTFSETETKKTLLTAEANVLNPSPLTQSSPRQEKKSSWGQGLTMGALIACVGLGLFQQSQLLSQETRLKVLEQKEARIELKLNAVERKADQANNLAKEANSKIEDINPINALMKWLQSLFSNHA